MCFRVALRNISLLSQELHFATKPVLWIRTRWEKDRNGGHSFSSHHKSVHNNNNTFTPNQRFSMKWKITEYSGISSSRLIIIIQMNLIMLYQESRTCQIVKINVRRPQIEYAKGIFLQAMSNVPLLRSPRETSSWKSGRNNLDSIWKIVLLKYSLTRKYSQWMFFWTTKIMTPFFYSLTENVPIGSSCKFLRYNILSWFKIKSPDGNYVSTQDVDVLRR